MRNLRKYKVEFKAVQRGRLSHRNYFRIFVQFLLLGSIEVREALMSYALH